MKCLFMLAVFVSATAMGYAQSPGAKTKPVSLTASQRDWLARNQQELARLPKDRAVALLKKNVPAISEAALEYFIAVAQRLQQSNGSARQSLERARTEMTAQRQQQLQQDQQRQQQAQKSAEALKKQTQLEKLVQELKQQRAQLVALIAQKEAELAAMVDPLTKELLKLLLDPLRQTLAALNDSIKEAEEALRKLQNG